MIKVKRIFPYLVLILFSIACFLPGIRSLPLFDRDSALFAQASKQMVDTGNYFQIQFQNKPRHLKPPGIYWLQAAVVKLTNERAINKAWAYQVPSYLGGLFSVLLLFGFSRKVLGDQVAFLAALLLETSLLLIIESHLIVTDAILLAFVVWMQGSLWKIYLQIKAKEILAWKWILNFWFALSLGILIKGLTPLFALLTILMIILLDRSIVWLKQLKPLQGLFIVVAVSLAWLIPISIASHSNFLWDMLRSDALPKVLGAQQSHGQPPGFFLLLLPLMFWPASLFLMHAGFHAWDQRKNSVIRFLLAWVIPIWIFFELMHTKLPEYVLPVYPALALLTASAIMRFDKQAITQRFRYFQLIYSGIWLLYSVVLAFLVSYVPLYVDHQLNNIAVMLSVLILVIAISAFIFSYEHQLKKAAAILIVGSAIVFANIYHFVLPTISNLWISQKVVAAVAAPDMQSILQKQPLLVMGFDEPSLVFYIGTHKVLYTTVDQLSTIKNPSVNLVLIDAKQLPALQQLTVAMKFSLITLGEINGFNYVKGQFVKLMLLKVTR
jgi:4-amino-4-deoxy-L-arabinose transferase-like glycosyltransferase